MPSTNAVTEDKENVMAEFKNCRLEIQLEAQSPLIHFQADEKHYEEHPGVTVRASEVKPKLDRFLIRKLGKTGGCLNELKKKYPSFFVDVRHDAFNYKMEIEHRQESVLVELSPKDKQLRYDLYYGNMGEGQETRKMGVISNPTVIIFCMVEGLRKLIQEHITEFFIVTNFGTMQNKGFGSFLPADCRFGIALKQIEEERIAGFLLEDVIDSMETERDCKKICYGIRFHGYQGQSDKKKNEYWIRIFKEIKQFYGIMKSGQNFCGFARSYIYDYMHMEPRCIDNEKAWMKQKGISPAVSTKKISREDRKDDNPKYVRAMLGTGETISYIKQAGRPCNEKGRVPVTITSLNEEINRVPSPIYFKIIKNVVFIVAREVPKEIYGAEFRFENQLWEKRDTLETPGEFDIDEFLMQYVDYYNGPLRKKVHNMDGNKKVVEIKCIDMQELR